MENVRKLIEEYLADGEYQEDFRRGTKRRNEVLPYVTSIAQRFAKQEINLQTFCAQLIESFKVTGERWGAQGNAFTIPLAKLFKYHDEHAPIAENRLRELLTDINVENLGIKIEQWYNFLLTERNRLRQEGKTAGVVVEAGRSALIMSLFTFWLHPEQQPIVFHSTVRSGLALLVKKGGFIPPQPLRIVNDSVLIVLNEDYQTVSRAIQTLGSLNENTINSTYGSDYFFYWIVQHFEKQAQPAAAQATLITEQDEAGVLASDPNQTTVVREAIEDYIGSDNGTSRLPANNPPLLPTPEPLLARLIRDVQRHILVEESVIRRIYHALLAGHVILSGPPGTGKTELARLIPEILWKRPDDESEEYNPEEVPLTTRTAYTTRLVTATDEWSVRTLISGITPVSKNGSVAYKFQFGYLASAIDKNWLVQDNKPQESSTRDLQRSFVLSSSSIGRDRPQTFRGLWLVIDEFNRAPIDLALGEALTALGGNEVLRVMTDEGSKELPIPRDFRVIGTLNSFDRNYLNQISEALKRRFSFVEILPPGRNLREAEQAMVLYKALERVSHLSEAIKNEGDALYWGEQVGIDAAEGQYVITWLDEEFAFREAFEAAWNLFEVVRVYRQLGTAQAISLVRHMLIAGLLQGYTTREQWIGQALDAALCDTIADQLQVLLPDEIEALLLCLTRERTAFPAAYNGLLAGLVDRPQRLYGHLLALGSVGNERGEPSLSDEEIEASAQGNPPAVPQATLSAIFHLDTPRPRLPQFTRRLRAFKAERGL